VAAHTSQWRVERYDGTSSGTGPLRSKKVKTINLKDTAKKTNKNVSNYKGGLMLWAADVCSRAAFAQPGPVSSISLGRFSSE